LNFITITFLVFTLATLLIYWLTKEKFRTPILLVTSYIFYAFWDWRFLSLLMLLTISNYWLTQKMYVSDSLARKKQILVLCLSINLLVLAAFKYLGFFGEGLSRMLELIGLSANLPTISIILPLGLSFFIFQTSSYIIDVYRGNLKPEASFVNFATFVVYFPHMAAGPIMPARVLIPQIASKKVRPNFDQVQSGLFLIAIGLFRKIVIADTLAPMVNRIFGSPGNFDWKSLIIASIGFGLQIYGDFAGYSAIARGVSRLFGIEMMINFSQPYLATSITDFWRRWHISLSTWFRDYLYIPLGGNKRSKLRTNVNLLIVMIIAGLWHGAAFGFIVWGLLHGIFLVFDKYAARYQLKSEKLTFILLPLSWILTQSAVFVAWIFFRNPDLSDALSILSSILNRATGTFEISDALLVLSALVASFSLDLSEKFLVPMYQKRSQVAKGMLIGSLLVISLVLKSSTVVPFIYFRF
jgi:D-alanyl-lipoteichoic acid acyltransferase DltB (MBOAT superfamily)